MFVNSNKYLLHFVLLLFPLCSGAQGFDADLDAIVGKVKAAENYTIASTVKVYTRKGGTLQHQIEASVTATKTVSLTVIGEVEMLQTATQMIVVDRDEKLIEVEHIPAPKQSKTKQRGKEALKLDELEKLRSKDSGLTFRLTATDGAVRTYTASNPKAGIKSLTIRLNATDKKMISYALEQQDANGNTEQYIVVEYTEFAYTVTRPELLKTTHFVVAEGSGYKASASFKGYNVTTK